MRAVMDSEPMRIFLRYVFKPAVFGGIVSGQFLGTSLIYELKGSELVEHEAVRDRVRAELGEDDYAAATARGAAMSYDDILGFTLGELDRIVAELGDD